MDAAAGIEQHADFALGQLGPERAAGRTDAFARLEPSFMAAPAAQLSGDYGVPGIDGVTAAKQAKALVAPGLTTSAAPMHGRCPSPILA